MSECVPECVFVGPVWWIGMYLQDENLCRSDFSIVYIYVSEHLCQRV